MAAPHKIRDLNEAYQLQFARRLIYWAAGNQVARNGAVKSGGLRLGPFKMTLSDDDSGARS